jgi:hypothetical protein
MKENIPTEGNRIKTDYDGFTILVDREGFSSLDRMKDRCPYGSSRPYAVHVHSKGRLRNALGVLRTFRTYHGAVKAGERAAAGEPEAWEKKLAELLEVVRVAALARGLKVSHVQKTAHGRILRGRFWRVLKEGTEISTLFRHRPFEYWSLKAQGTEECSGTLEECLDSAAQIDPQLIAPIVLTNAPEPGTSAPHQPDPLLRQRVEQIAIEKASAYFTRLGYRVDSVEQDNVGWDLNAVANRRCLRLEVKGLAGSQTVLELTPNEYAAMKEYRESYKVCVVTNALTKPRLEVFSYSRAMNCWESPAHRVLKIQEIIAARCSAT